jgi:hypothetical protein
MALDDNIKEALEAQLKRLGYEYLIEVVEADIPPRGSGKRWEMADAAFTTENLDAHKTLANLKRLTSIKLDPVNGCSYMEVWEHVIDQNSPVSSIEAEK